MAASAPRCTWKPVIASSTSVSARYTGTSAPSTPSPASIASTSASQRGEHSTERGRCPAASALPSTVEDSAMYNPRSGSIRRRSATSVSDT